MKRRAHALATPAVALVLAAASAGCASDCERFKSFPSVATPACGACRAERCGDAGRSYAAAPATCQAELACAARCPDRSGATCGCIESCLPTRECRAALDALIACDVSACADACR